MKYEVYFKIYFTLFYIYGNKFYKVDAHSVESYLNNKSGKPVQHVESHSVFLNKTLRTIIHEIIIKILNDDNFIVHANIAKFHLYNVTYDLFCILLLKIEIYLSIIIQSYNIFNKNESFHITFKIRSYFSI